MGFPADDQADHLAPLTDGAWPRQEERLAGTGTTEDSNTAALANGARASLTVGAAALRVSFRSTGGAATQVAVTAHIIPAYTTYSWLVENGSRFVYAEAADGVAAYEAWVWTSSPGNK
jgi:hypothetical protein